MKAYSTVQAAKLLGVAPDTIHRWIRGKKITAPGIEHIGGVEIRLWSDEDVEKLKKYKANHYWGRGSKKTRKKKNQVKKRDALVL
jgi:excisionase family DNA binding protein